MYQHKDLNSSELFHLVHQKKINLGGYKKNKIYGLLSCKAGKRMKQENRVFFKSEAEAIENGYRPCGACLPEKYKLWKEGKSFAGNL